MGRAAHHRSVAPSQCEGQWEHTTAAEGIKGEPRTKHCTEEVTVWPWCC